MLSQSCSLCEWEFSRSINVLFSEVTSDSLGNRTLKNELFGPVTEFGPSTFQVLKKEARHNHG